MIINMSEELIENWSKDNKVLIKKDDTMTNQSKYNNSS